MKLNEIKDKKRTLFSQLPSINQQIRQDISQAKEQLNDHLISINDNTSEIQANYEFMCKIDSKIDKLNERLDQISMFLKEKAGFEFDEKPEFNPMKLTKREKEVFLFLYTLESSENGVTYLDIARGSGLTEDLVSSYITNMIEKNIPIKKRYINGKAHLKLDAVFKSLQAKENILKIEQTMISNLL